MEHDTEQFAYEHCGKRTSRANSKKRHKRRCEGDITDICPKCNKCCATDQGLKRHIQWHDKTQNQTSSTTAKASTSVSSTLLQHKVGQDERGELLLKDPLCVDNATREK